MTSTFQKTFKATALFLVFSIFQVLVVGVSAAPTPMQDGVKGKLRTTGNQNIIINGNAASNGHTVLTGAMIETPQGVGATINLSSLGSIDFSPGSRAEVTFSDGQIRVLLIQGCVIVHTRLGTYGEIATPQGKATSNDPVRKEAATLDVCNPAGAPAPIINQGAAANAGAGAGAAGTTERVGAGWIFFGGAGLVTLIALAVIIPCERGTNPSPSDPSGVSGDCR
jgi:hypothetical protein